MTKIQNSKQYDLEERTLRLTQRVRVFMKKLPKTIANIEDSRQLVNASGSVGANYQEGFSNANQDMPKRSERKPILASAS
jgi:four helix bundle protein